MKSTNNEEVLLDRKRQNIERSYDMFRSSGNDFNKIQVFRATEEINLLVRDLNSEFIEELFDPNKDPIREVFSKYGVPSEKNSLFHGASFVISLYNAILKYKNLYSLFNILAVKSDYDYCDHYSQWNEFNLIIHNRISNTYEDLRIDLDKGHLYPPREQYLEGLVNSVKARVSHTISKTLKDKLNLEVVSSKICKDDKAFRELEVKSNFGKFTCTIHNWSGDDCQIDRSTFELYAKDAVRLRGQILGSDLDSGLQFKEEITYDLLKESVLEACISEIAPIAYKQGLAYRKKRRP
tara:strand:- start:29618 stop:30499 length:882 start_codon:yes stop_codon:yes gene_type:complete